MESTAESEARVSSGTLVAAARPEGLGGGGGGGACAGRWRR